MENVPQHIDEIRKAFTIMKDKSDFVKVLNIAKSHLYGAKAVDFRLSSVTYYADPRLAKERYQVFQIPKKNSGTRTIHAPVAGLKVILRSLNFVLQCVYEKHFTPVTTGFVPGKSIVDNARRHIGKQFVFNLDLKDFFPSVDLYRVKAVLGLPPFNLKDEREPLAYLIANLCCQVMEVERYNDQCEIVVKSLPVLPQGAPTSPILSNVVCYRLDRHLRSVAKRFGATYSRYADDITFSGNYDIYEEEGNFIKEVRRIIQEERFIVNEKKVRLQRPWYRQEVTGLIVNKQPNVPRDYVKQVRRWIYLWETYGQVKAESLFRRDYVSDKKRLAPPMEKVLEGKLLYMQMVTGSNNTTFLKLVSRFNNLVGNNEEAIKILPKQSKNTYPNVTSTKIISENVDGEIIKCNHDARRIPKFFDALYRDPVIKSALHRWDGEEKPDISKVLVNEFNQKDFIRELKKRIKLCIKQYSIPTTLQTKINRFFVVEEQVSKYKVQGWSQDKITIGWNTKDIKKWCEENLGKWPLVYSTFVSYEGYKFDSPKKFGKRKYSEFAEIVSKFKAEIQFRTDCSNNLKQFFERLSFERKELNININIKDGIEFYADVEKFKQGLNHLFNGIEEFQQCFGNNIEVYANDEGRKVVITLTHKNSYIKKSFNSFRDRIASGEGNTLGKAKENFREVCDWTISSSFSDDISVCFPVLTTIDKQIKIIKPEAIPGLVYEFTFYRAT